jgi:hypothetical protein
MQTKALEFRDEGTFIPVLAVNMNPLPIKAAGSLIVDPMETHSAQRYLLLRVGYPCDGRPNILLTRLSGDGQATNDPYGWKCGTRTFRVAHAWIIEHWAEIKDGDVIDVQWILGETADKKPSERVSYPAAGITADGKFF